MTEPERDTATDPTADPAMEPHTTTAAPARRRSPDPVALVFGVLALALSVAAVTGHLPLLPGFDPRWLLAAGAAVLGLLLLVGSLRRR
jgi:fatty acid desaturase